MKTQSFPGIQVMRALAATLVMLTHILWTYEQAYSTPSPWHRRIVLFGNIGVDIFFIISGFVVTYVAFSKDKKPNPQEFLLRRLFRIYPIYWFAFAIMIIATFAGLRQFGDYTMMLRDFLLIPQVVQDPVVSVSWTLCWEVVFYFIFSASLFARDRRLAIGLASLGLFAVIGVGQFFDNLRLNDVEILVEFPFGMMLAHFWLKFKGFKFLRVWYIFPVLFVAFFFTSRFRDLLDTDDLHWYRLFCWLPVSIFIVACSLSLKSEDRKYWSIPIFIGDASYSLYLFHYFWTFVGDIIIRNYSPSQAELPAIEVAMLSCALISGVAGYLFVDKPIIDYLSKRKPWRLCTRNLATD